MNNHWNTGLMFSGVSLISRGEGASLALADNCFSDDATNTLWCR